VMISNTCLVAKRNGHSNLMNRLVLIDGNAIMHRAYHALPPLTTPDGKPAHVVYGFVSMIIKIFHALKPTHFAVAFDRPGPTFRNELYKEYQIQRPKMEDDFISQIPMVHDVVKAFGIPIFELDGFEADDMIGTIAKQRKSKKIDQVIIVTGDRDILQLVEDEKVLVFMPTKGLSEGKLYSEADVLERMGVVPKRIIDLKALMGDASDNYPGVAGIGPKTAIHLLNEFGSVENIYTSLEKSNVSDGVKTKLLAGKESAFLGVTLATIRTDAPIHFEPAKAVITTLDTPEVRNTLASLRFSSLLRRISGEELATSEMTKARDTTKQKKKEHDEQQMLF